MVEVLSDIDIAVSDGSMGHGVEALIFRSLLDVVWEEETLWGGESWAIDLDNLTIWQFVVLGKFLGVFGLGFIGSEVE